MYMTRNHLCVHTVSACMHPCPQESQQYWGLMGVNPWQQARASVLNSREKSSMMGECRKNSGRKPQKSFLEVLQCLLCQRPNYTYMFSLPAGMTMGSFISLLRKCQSSQMDCKLLERAGSFLFVFSQHGGEGRGTTPTDITRGLFCMRKVWAELEWESKKSAKGMGQTEGQSKIRGRKEPE